MAEPDAPGESYGWTFAETERRQAAAGLTMTPAQRLQWLEEVLDELLPLLGAARHVSPEPPQPDTDHQP